MSETLAAAVQPLDFVVAVWLGMPRDDVLRGLREGWVRPPPGTGRLVAFRRRSGAGRGRPVPTAYADRRAACGAGSLASTTRSTTPASIALWHEAGDDERRARRTRCAASSRRSLGLEAEPPAAIASRPHWFAPTARAASRRCGGLGRARRSALAKEHGEVRAALAHSLALGADRRDVAAGAVRSGRALPSLRSRHRRAPDVGRVDRGSRTARCVALVARRRGRRRRRAMAGASWTGRRARRARCCSRLRRRGPPGDLRPRRRRPRARRHHHRSHPRRCRRRRPPRARRATIFSKAATADDLLLGGAEGDDLAGGRGDDELEGGAGDDRLSGGTRRRRALRRIGPRPAARRRRRRSSTTSDAGTASTSSRTTAGSCVVDGVELAGSMAGEGAHWRSGDGALPLPSRGSGLGSHARDRVARGTARSRKCAIGGKGRSGSCSRDWTPDTSEETASPSPVADADVGDAAQEGSDDDDGEDAAASDARPRNLRPVAWAGSRCRRPPDSSNGVMSPRHCAGRGWPARHRCGDGQRREVPTAAAIAEALAGDADADDDGEVGARLPSMRRGRRGGDPTPSRRHRLPT